jgi:hypothetical protein
MNKIARYWKYLAGNNAEQMQFYLTNIRVTNCMEDEKEPASL